MYRYLHLYVVSLFLLDEVLLFAIAVNDNWIGHSERDVKDRYVHVFIDKTSIQTYI